ncbi:MAG: DEAD/DEAH box helicase [Anaerolineae bacterium]|nr:DEAD/DEAH box helicase [Anaerolineae bacterium]
MTKFSAQTALYPAQQRAFDKLHRSKVAGLFMEMGIGKTRTYIEFVRHRQRTTSRVVWFCPVSIKETARQEILKHTDSAESDIITFDDRTSSRNIPLNRFWYIIGIESMSSSDRVVLTADTLIDENTFVIVDESDLLKNPAAIRSRRIIALAHRAKRRVIGTGTPMSEGVIDLYAQMYLLSPKILGYNSFWSFARNHLEFHPDYPGLVVRNHNTGYLASRIAPYTYQVTKDEALPDLPAKLYDNRYLSMTSEQRELYNRAKWQILMDAEELDSYIIFQLFTACQQITSGFWNELCDGHPVAFHEVPHERLDLLIDTIGRIPPSEKIVIWCKFRHSVQRIVERLSAEFNPDAITQYHGDLREHERNQQKVRFVDEARFFVATMQTAGRGLNELVCSNHAIFYENEFRYRSRLQAEDRQHRPGQTHRPTYIDLICSNSIDTRIRDAHDKKESVTAAFRRKLAQLRDLDSAERKQKLLEML